MVVFMDYGFLDLEAEAARSSALEGVGPPAAGGRTLQQYAFPGWQGGAVAGARRPELCGWIEGCPDLEVFEGAPGVAEASFGPDVRPGPAAKALSTPVMRPAAFPWRATVSLAITAADGSLWNGTGWFAGPRTVVTAAHSVYVHGSDVRGRDGWVRSVSVMPGRSGTQLPFGAVTVGRQAFRAAEGWTEERDGRADYGAIVLNKPLGRLTGWYGFGVYDDQVLTRSSAHIAGYPCDKPAGTLWQQGGPVAAVTKNRVRCDKGVAVGESGGALVRMIAGQPYAFAIHNYSGWYASIASRITAPVYQQLLCWRR